MNLYYFVRPYFRALNTLSFYLRVVWISILIFVKHEKIFKSTGAVTHKQIESPGCCLYMDLPMQPQVTSALWFIAFWVYIRVLLGPNWLPFIMDYGLESPNMRCGLRNFFIVGN